MPTGGKQTPIDPGIIARVVAGARYAFTGRAPDAWMGPGEPMPPVPSPQEQEGVRGRRFDFDTAYNASLQQRRAQESSAGVTFDQLRALADNYDLLRLIIERRKDQLSRMAWDVKPRKGFEEADPDGKQAREIREFLRFPDRQNIWDDWLRALVEDMLVIDAATLMPRPTLSGGLYALELMDGATIRPVLDATGRRPLPPDPAFQQFLKGVPAVDYTADDLIYRPRVLRTHRVYGFSPVEQIIMTVQIALRRQLTQLDYFTAGTVPDALASVPKEWSGKDIADFQARFDEMLSRNTGERRKLRFIPDGLNFHETKQSPLKDDFDEWLARITCFCFSVSPQPFVKEVNRATAETAQETAIAEGLLPTMTWVKGTMDIVCARYFGAPALEFAWVPDDAPDPLEQAKVHQIYVAAEVMDVDEVREELGKPAQTAEQQAAIASRRKVPPPAPGATPADGNPPPDGATPQKQAAAAPGDVLVDVGATTINIDMGGERHTTKVDRPAQTIPGADA